MMEIPLSSWTEYIAILRQVNDKATELVRKYLEKYRVPQTTEEIDALIRYAYKVSTTLGEASSAAAAKMYDNIAKATKVKVPAAEPAPTPTYGEVAKTVNGMLKNNYSEDAIGSSIGRLVKRTGVDTTLHNALRDGAEFAWVPQGDTCAFCLMLASNGWQRASKDAIRGGHADHIHANCDCTYAIRFDGKSGVEGYDPDKYREIYDDAEGDNWEEKLRSMERDEREAHKDEINARKRELYAEKKIDDVIKMAAQEGKNATIPSSMESSFDDCHPLSISEEDRDSFRRIHDKAFESGHEYGEIITPTRVIPCESNLDDHIEMATGGIDEYGLKLYHGHTNDTLPSERDLFRLVWDEKVNEIGVVTRNNDVFRVSVGDGYIPTKEEFWSVVRKASIDAEKLVIEKYDISKLTENELNYLYIREKNIEIIHQLGWRVEGGKL